MKNFKFLFIILIIFIGITSVYAVDSSLKVYDYASVLTSNEEKMLRESVTNYINKNNIDMVLVTVKHHTKDTTESYAKDFYNQNNFGIGNTKDGIIFVIDFTFENTNFYILPFGESKKIYDNNRINNILNNIYSKDNLKYYDHFQIFIKDASEYINSGLPTNSNNNSRNKNLIIKKIILFIVLFAISLIISTFIMLFLIIKSKKSVKNKYISNYVKNDSLIIDRENDKFITTHTYQIRVNNLKK